MSDHTIPQSDVKDLDIVVEALRYLIEMYYVNAGWTAAMSRKPLSALPETTQILVTKAARAEAELRHLERS